MFEAAIEAGAERCRERRRAARRDLARRRISTRSATRSKSRFGPADSARLVWRPKTTSPIDEETAASLFKLLETLEDSDDVQNVYANFEVGRRRDGAARRLTATSARTEPAMRVLGLDPGLRHTGWGIIDVAGNRLTHVADGVVHAADRPAARDAAGIAVPADHRRARTLPPGRGGGRGDLRQPEPGLDLEARRRPRRRPAGAGRARPAGRRIFGQSGQEVGRRRRPCRQGAGADDGAADPAGLRDRRAGRRRCARRRDLPRAPRRRHGAGGAPRR